MLAYLFFHQAAAGVNREEYENGLRRFHAALGDAKVRGFIASRTYLVGGRYCDWYLVESSAALDLLNDAAVSGARAALHDVVAHQATGGAGKLLKLAAGEPDLEAGVEIRLSKPQGMGYSDFYAELKPWTERRDVSLWRRLMVLGPPPEFVLLSSAREVFPKEMGPEILTRQPV